MKLSVVIPTKERYSLLHKCINSIINHDILADELIIVDQSKQNYEKFIQELIPKNLSFIYIHNAAISGLTMARNIGLRYVSGDIALFLDDDIELLPGAIANLRTIFENDSICQIGGVGLAINNYSCDYLGRINYLLFFRGPFKGMRRFDYFQRYYKKYNLNLYESSMIGGVSCYRKEVFREFIFDENFAGYSFGEDFIFGYRVSRVFKTFLSSSAEVIHFRAEQNRPSEDVYIGMQVVFWFYFFYAYLPKTLFNVFCYIFLDFGFFLRIIRLIFASSLMRAILCSYKQIIKFLFRKIAMEELVKENLS